VALALAMVTVLAPPLPLLPPRLLLQILLTLHLLNILLTVAIEPNLPIPSPHPLLLSLLRL